MTKINSRYVSARSGSVARSLRAASTASRVKVARIVIASRAVNSPLSTFDAVWMTSSTATRTTRHYEAADAAPGHRFAEAVFAAGGVAAIYGVNDFITVTGQPGFEWDPIVAAVVAAAERDL